jgi:hypothetical protein
MSLLLKATLRAQPFDHTLQRQGQLCGCERRSRLAARAFSHNLMRGPVSGLPMGRKCRAAG